MKNVIACPTGVWAERLFTVERFQTIKYFLGETEGIYTKEGYFEKQIRPFDYLKCEQKQDIIVIITDTHKYNIIKEKLMQYGLTENVNFFNGWKLHSNFYNLMYTDTAWKEFEKENRDALERQRRGWMKRAEEMVKLIPKDTTSILDIGCGEGLLKRYLSKNIKYYGLDYCKRDENTIVCDLNKENIPDLSVDMYYLAGVIDYIENIPLFIKQFINVKYVILSKTRNERFIRLDDKSVDEGYLNYGINPYYSADLITDMYKNRFVCEKVVWNYQTRDEYYYLFKNIR